jgi:hypothetical protein
MATNAGVTAMWDDRASLGLTQARLFLYEFEVLEEHRRQMDESLRAAMRDAEARHIAERGANIGNMEFMLAWAEQFHEVYELLPTLQWNAQLVLAYSTFEHAMNRVCRMAKIRTGSTIDFGKYKGPSGRDTGIFKAKSFLGEVANINAPFAGAEWAAVGGLNKLRNAIAHTNAEFSDPPEQRELDVQALVPTWQGVRVVMNPDGTPQRFRLTPEFLRYAVSTLRQVLELVCAEEPSTTQPLA